jgi:class 3 adenylate cyclase
MRAAEQANSQYLVERIAAEWAAAVPGDYWRWAARDTLRSAAVETAQAVAVLGSVRYGDDRADAGFLVRHLQELLAGVIADSPREFVNCSGDQVLFAFRGQDAEPRAAAAARALVAAAAKRNRVRRLMKWPLWDVRVAIAAGPVAVAQIGAPNASGRALVGEAVAKAADLLTLALPSRPCATADVGAALSCNDPSWTQTRSHPTRGPFWERRE